MQTNNIIVNNVWTPVLMITSDTEQTYGFAITDGDKRYNVTPLKSWHDEKYHYWFIINSIEIINLELQKQVDTLSDENNALGKQVTSLTLANAQKDGFIQQIGKQVTTLTLEVAALKGGNA